MRLRHPMAKHDAKKTARIVRSLPFQPAAPALARHVGSPLPSAAVEEVLDVRNIQGNILAGFNKDHQAFVFLTLTLVTGIAFSETLFGRALRADHKTVFAVLSWLTFGLLLAGRVLYGWRGRTALRWTLSGFMMLLFAYVGSRFVLEVLLHRA